MIILRRGSWLIPFVLLAWAFIVSGQDNPLRLAGSSIVAPIIQAVAPAGVSLTVTTDGTAAGFNALCQNQVDAVAASRALSPAEEAACASAGVTFQEYLVAQNYLAVIGNPADTFNTCLTTATLSTLLQPSAAVGVTNWIAVAPENPDLPLTVFVPPADTLDYAILDDVVNGRRLRADAQTASSQDIINSVASTAGAIGIVPFAALTGEQSVALLPLDNGDGTGCVTPDPASFDAGVYTLGSNFYLYINLNATAAAGDLLTALADPASAEAIAALGYIPPSINSLETNRQAAAGEISGRTFTRQAEVFNIPTGLAGEVTLGGSPALTSWLKAASDSFVASQPDLRFTLKFDGEPGGLRRFCNGELDIVAAVTTLTGDAATNCEANNITTFDVPLGAKAVVLVANAADSYAACLTTDQISRLWDATTQADVQNWNVVDESFADQSLTLFAPNAGDAADLLLRRDGLPTPPIRSDAQFSDDPLYRAAAVANVPGALTFMTWNEYSQVLANNQERIQLVAVDGGSGCVTPAETTIVDGTYPLTLTATLLVNRASLSNINVQSYLWTLFDPQTSLPVYESLGLIGRAGDFFTAIRSDLLVAFAEAAAAQAAPETTPEPGIEVTAEATAEATMEMTPEATAEATMEMTAEATAEATMEMTAEATAEATMEMTPEATQAVTPEATVEVTAPVMEVTPEVTPAS